MINKLLRFICVAILFNACSKKTEETNSQKFEISKELQQKISLSTVKSQPIVGKLELTGKVIPDENNLVNIYPMVGGKVMSVDVEIGELVSTSKPLVVINSGEAREFEKEYIAAKDEYELAKKNYEIQLDLHKSKFSSERELAYAKKDMQLAKAELSRLEEVYKVYSLTNGGNYVIKSPVAGFVIEKKIGPNMQIRPDMNDYILSIARLEEVFVALNVYENDISKIKLGQKIKIKSFSYPDSLFYGNISRIENVIDPTTRTVQARVKLSNPNFIFKPEMNCIGTLQFQEKGTLPAIERSAVIFDKNKYFVLVYHSPTNIETRTVEIHSMSDDLAFVSSGLKEGEKVITKEQLYIYDALND